MTTSPSLARVVLGLTGGIAAYKAAELARLFVKAGTRVDVVMTAGACRFITPMTMQALTGRWRDFGVGSIWEWRVCWGFLRVFRGRRSGATA